MRTVVLAAFGLVGCSQEEPHLGVVSSASTVGSFVSSSCSTSVVLELSRQIAEEVDCMMPGQLVPFEEQGGVRINGSAVLPFLDEEARADLYAATAGGQILKVNSAFRTVVQQYLLREWFDQGRCGITAAAAPGTSNHESGRALDVDNYYDWVGVLASHNWAHDVPGDEVHFDHLSSPDIRGADVLAFQRLWNRNHAADQIAEDGDYGPQTGARVAAAPAEGFPIGAQCMSGGDRSLDVVEVTGPAVIAPGEHGHFTVHVSNTGSLAWPATATLVTATGAPSPLADPGTWDSTSEVLALGTPVAPGGDIELEFDVVGPAVDVATPIAERFTLADGGDHFGAVPIAVTVDPADDPGQIGDGDGGPGSGDGGCSAAGGGGGSGLIGLALVGLVARRRPRYS